MAAAQVLVTFVNGVLDAGVLGEVRRFMDNKIEKIVVAAALLATFAVVPRVYADEHWDRFVELEARQEQAMERSKEVPFQSLQYYALQMNAVAFALAGCDEMMQVRDRHIPRANRSFCKEKRAEVEKLKQANNPAGGLILEQVGRIEAGKEP